MPLNRVVFSVRKGARPISDKIVLKDLSNEELVYLIQDNMDNQEYMCNCLFRK